MGRNKVAPGRIKANITIKFRIWKFQIEAQNGVRYCEEFYIQCKSSNSGKFLKNRESLKVRFGKFFQVFLNFLISGL